MIIRPNATALVVLFMSETIAGFRILPTKSVAFEDCFRKSRELPLLRALTVTRGQLYCQRNALAEPERRGKLVGTARFELTTTTLPEM
jgi:hypothetical protein